MGYYIRPETCELSRWLNDVLESDSSLTSFGAPSFEARSASYSGSNFLFYPTLVIERWVEAPKDDRFGDLLLEHRGRKTVDERTKACRPRSPAAVVRRTPNCCEQFLSETAITEANIDQRGRSSVVLYFQKINDSLKLYRRRNLDNR
jgi:hypothetical protein